MIKTFYTGPLGWTDQQRPDGTIVFTAPTGHTYTTEATGGLLFPTLARPTAPLHTSTAAEPTTSPHRGAMMPTRRTTRDQDRRARIDRERRHRLDINAEHERQHQAWLAATYQPPPF